MAVAFSKYEIDYQILKLIVGVIALTLGSLTAFLSSVPLASISASYYEGGWARDIFIGFLYAISAFLLAYNGLGGVAEMVMSKIAAVAALGVAMFPCRCGDHAEIVPYVHGISAAIMFVTLALFCWIFYRRARAKGHTEADRRAYIYAICGVVIVGAVGVLALDRLTNGSISSTVERLTYHGEHAGLLAFGVSWLVSSKTLPFLTAPDERVRVLPLAKK